MTAEALETVFTLLLSAGAFEGKTFWHGEQNGSFAFYNGSGESRTFLVETSGEQFRVLYGNPEVTASEGILQVEIPPGTLAVLMTDDGNGQGVEKDGILYTAPKKGGIIRCESDAVAAQYVRYNGKRELIRLYTNGDTVSDADGEIRFFRWDKMQPR